jgi:hypothetical protein
MVEEVPQDAHLSGGRGAEGRRHAYNATMSTVI